MSLMKEIFKRTKLVEADGASDAVDAVRADALDLGAHRTTLNHEDIMQHINRAEEDEDAVETITFGLETDNDEIVKVYVAVSDADAFEKELAKLLGTEDTIEDALNELADKFDIVDVVWPEGDDEEADEEFGDDEDLKVDFDSSDEEDESSDETEAEDKLDSELKKDDRKDMKKEGSMPLFRSLLGESTEHASLGDNALNQLHDEAATRYQQLVIEVLAGLGVPGNVVSLKRAIFKRNLRDVGQELMHNSHLRIWMKRLADRLNITDSSEKIDIEDEEDIKENFEVDELARKSLQNKIARSIFDLISALGVPTEAIRARRAIIKRQIMDKAFEIAKDNQTKVALNMVVDAMGVGTNPKMGKQFDEPDKISEAVKLGTSSYTDAVTALLDAIGIPEANLTYQNFPLRKSIEAKRNSLQSPAVIASKMEILTNLINGSVKKPTSVSQPSNESIHIDALIDGLVRIDEEEEGTFHMNDLIRGSVLNESSDAEPVDLGAWNFAMLGDTTIVGIEDQTFKLDPSVADTFINALNDNSVVSIKAKDGSRLSARPTKKTEDGKPGFVVKCQGCKNYPDGIIMHASDVEALNDVVNS